MTGRFTGDDKELSVEDRGDRFPYPYQKVYTIQLYSPVSWEVLTGGTGYWRAEQGTDGRYRVTGGRDGVLAGGTGYDGWNRGADGRDGY